MPKKTPVTAAQIKAVIDAAIDASLDARDYDRDVRNGYVEADAVTLNHISSLMVMSREFADLAGGLIYQFRLAEIRAKDEAELAALRGASIAESQG